MIFKIFFRYIYRLLTTFFLDVKMIYLDIKNKKQFKQDVIVEKEDYKSKFNSFNMTVNANYDIISAVVNIPEAFQVGSINDIERMNKLREMTIPMTRYLSIDFGWGEYLTMPEYYHIEDPADEHESLTYLVIWKFQPYMLGNFSIIKDFFLFLLGVLLVLGIVGIIVIILGGIFGGVVFNFIDTINAHMN